MKNEKSVQVNARMRRTWTTPISPENQHIYNNQRGEKNHICKMQKNNTCKRASQIHTDSLCVYKHSHLQEGGKSTSSPVRFCNIYSWYFASMRSMQMEKLRSAFPGKRKNSRYGEICRSVNNLLNSISMDSSVRRCGGCEITEGG